MFDKDAIIINIVQLPDWAAAAIRNLRHVFTANSSAGVFIINTARHSSSNITEVQLYCYIAT